MKTLSNQRVAWLLAVSLCISPLAYAQDESTDIVMGQRISLYSETLDEQRSILVSKPIGYDESDEAYAVLIVLDGYNHYFHTTSLAWFLQATQQIPGMLVVSVENTIRPRDMTPPTEAQSDIQNFPMNGGAANFQTFIADELIPWIDDNYRTRNYRILVGHSHGGLFAIYSLTTRPEIFDAYIAISPSLQWDEQRFSAQAGAFLADRDELNASLFVTAANEGGEMLGGIRQFAASLDANAPRGFDWRFEHLPTETHGTVPMRSTYRGLEFVFADWTLREDAVEIHDRYGVEAIERFYAMSDVKYGVDRGTPVFELTRLAVALLDAGRLDDVISLIRRYSDEVQPPPRILVNIAAEYEARDRTESAIEVYRMALEISGGDPNDQDPAVATARERLAELAPE